MIPAAAIEAAMRVLSTYIDERLSENDPNSKYTREGAAEILEAAAPYMLSAQLERLSTDLADALDRLETLRSKQQNYAALDAISELGDNTTKLTKTHRAGTGTA